MTLFIMVYILFKEELIKMFFSVGTTDITDLVFSALQIAYKRAPLLKTDLKKEDKRQAVRFFCPPFTPLQLPALFL